MRFAGPKEYEYLVLRVGMLGPRMSTIDPVFLPHLSA
jgi:hypothetical protein